MDGIGKCFVFAAFTSLLVACATQPVASTSQAPNTASAEDTGASPPGASVAPAVKPADTFKLSPADSLTLIPQQSLFSSDTGGATLHKTSTDKSLAGSGSSGTTTQTQSKSAPAATTNTSGTKDAEDKKRKPDIDLTPFTTFSEIASNSSATTSYSDAYTRIRIDGDVAADATPSASTSTNAAEKTEPYLYRERSWLARYLLGKKFDFNLAVKITIGDYETTIPLVTVSHESDSSGEQWTRTLSHNLVDFPLFLVKADGSSSIPIFDIKLSADKTINSSIAGAALQVAIGGIQQVSPGSSVLTTLTAQSSKTKANAIDTAISKLFSDGITEEHIAHSDLRAWQSADGVIIKVQIPHDETNWNSELQSIGTWKITFEAPQPSIFLGLAHLRT